MGLRNGLAWIQKHMITVSQKVKAFAALYVFKGE
jgi:hypothetical protein